MSTKAQFISGMIKLKKWTTCVEAGILTFHDSCLNTRMNRCLCGMNSRRLHIPAKFNHFTVKDPSMVQSLYHGQTVNPYSTATGGNNKTLLDHLCSRIKASGPITVADYMREVLTNPQSGYYMHKDVFGTQGDFITSPEISQMFGEMLGIWVINEWMNQYDGQEIQIVELGPGRGTLADDMLRVFSQFPTIKDKVSLHLVEVSPTLGGMQAAKLSGNNVAEPIKDITKDQSSGPYNHCKSKYGQDVFWYQSINDVPKGLSCFIAHEFLDALPIHKFQKTERGWCEVLVNIDDIKDSTNKLSYVLSPGDTAASVAYLKPNLAINDEREHIEVSPGSALVVQTIANRIKADGGFALVADYGHNGEKADTFRAFKNHNLHDPLIDPGTADLTADVDFSYLRNFTKDSVSVHGPITQEKFLTNMGIGVRLQMLLKNAKTDEWASLVSGFRMLTSPDQMGERFKFMALSPKSQSSYNPAGFAELKFDE